MTGDGRSQGGIAGYPDVPYHSGVDAITDEITAATEELGRKVDHVTNVLRARPEDPRVSTPAQSTSPQPDADGRGRISGRQDGFAYDRLGGESGREEGTYDRRGESAHGGHGGVSRTPGHGTHPQEGSPESEHREEGSGDERNQIGLELGHEREGVEYGRQDGGHRRPDGEHGLPGGGGHSQLGGGHDQTGGEHGQPIGGQAQPGGGHGQLGGGHSQQGGGHGQTGGGHSQPGGGHGQTGGGHRQHGGGHGRPGGGLEQPGAGHDQSGSGQGQLGGRYGQQGGRQGQQGGRQGQQGGRQGQQGGRQGQQGGGLGQQGGRFGQQGGGRFGQHGSGQSGPGQRGRGQGVQGGGHARQGVARDGEEQGSESGLPARETSTAQYERPHASGTGHANVEGRQDGTESRVEGTHGNQHGIYGRHDETQGRQNGLIDRQDGVHGRQGGVHGRQDGAGSRQGEFGGKAGGTHGRQGGAGSRIDVATGRLDGRQDPSIVRVDVAYGGRDGLHGSSVGLPGRTGSTGTVSWGAGYGQGSQGFSQSTGITPGHSGVHTESDLDGQDFDSDSEHGLDDDDTGSGQGVDQQGLPFGNEDFPVVAEPESSIAVTGVEGFVVTAAETGTPIATAETGTPIATAETGTPIANGTGGDYEESEYDYYYEEAEEEEEDDDDESFDDYKYYEDYNEAVRRKRQQRNFPGQRFTTLAPDVASTPREAGRLARPNAILRNASNVESGIGSHQLSRTLRGRKRTTTATGNAMHDTPESNDVIESSENDDSIIALRSTGTNNGTTSEPDTTPLKGLPGDAGPTSRRIIRPGPPVRSGGKGTLHLKKRPQKNTFPSNATGGGGYPRLQTLRKLAKKWRARKQLLQRAKREAGEDLTWI